MKKAIFSFVFIFGLVMFISAAAKTIGNDEYQKVTEEQISSIVSEEKLTNYEVKNLVNKDKHFSVISYNRDGLFGFFTVTNLNGKLEYVKSLETKSNKKETVQTLGVTTGKPFLILLINDETLLKSASLLTVLIGREEYKQKVKEDQRFYIIEIDQYDYEEPFVYFTDQSGKIIYEHLNKEASYNIDLYTLYYSLEAKKMLFGTQFEHQEDLISILTSTSFEKEVLQKNNIFDLWLYTQTLKMFSLELPDKKLVSKFLEDLQTSNGFFLSQSNEDISNVHENYILSTKLALDIYSSSSIEPSNPDKISTWLNKTFRTLQQERKDFLSFGGYLHLIKSIDDSLLEIGETFTMDGQEFQTYLKQTEIEYRNSANNIEKFDTAIQINKVFNKEILEVEQSLINSLIKDKQLDDGSFPIYGQKQPDVMTTFLYLKVANELNIEIPRKEKLKEYLETQLLVSMKH
jgi:hypothetical protein